MLKQTGLQAFFLRMFLKHMTHRESFSSSCLIICRWEFCAYFKYECRTLFKKILLDSDSFRAKNRLILTFEYNIAFKLIYGIYSKLHLFVRMK